MAEIVKARDTSPPGLRIVAIKRVLPHLADDRHYKAMFVDESRVLTQLEHPSIIRAFEIGEIGGVAYIALEYVHGQDARELFHALRKAGQKLPVALACYIVARVCEGLHHAHEQTDAAGHSLGIVHRDVSLQNILLSYEGDVKLTDFGIAVSAGNVARTEAGVVKGKFGYMSPEQIRGATLDRRADVFASGICLYELLTGERLFSGDNDYKAVERVRNAEVEAPSSINRQIPSSLERIVLKALAKRPRDRYQTTNDLRRALQGFLVESKEHAERADLGAFVAQTFASDFAATEQERAEIRAQSAASDRVTALQAQSVFIDDAESTIVAPAGLVSEIFAKQQAAAFAENEPNTGLAAFSRLEPKSTLHVGGRDVGGIAVTARPPSADDSVPLPLDSDAPTPLPAALASPFPAPPVPPLIPAPGSIPRPTTDPGIGAKPLGPPLHKHFDMEWDEEEPTTINQGLVDEPEPAKLGPARKIEPSPALIPEDETTSFYGAPLQLPAAGAPPMAAETAPHRSLPTLTLARAGMGSNQWLIGAIVALALLALVAFLSRDRGSASLRIETEPKDAQVMIDGRRAIASASPFLVTGLAAAATHTIVVEKPGYTSWSTQLRVRSGKVFPLPLVRLDLLSAPAPQALPPPTSAPPPTQQLSAAEAARPAGVPRPIPLSAQAKPKPTPARRVDKPTVAPRSQPTAAPRSQPAAPIARAAGGGMGTLRINSRPWSTIKIDGTAYGNTPQMNLQLRAGTHTVVLENASFKVKKSLSVEIKAGEVVTRAVTLMP
jgi:hypothetical protein